MHSVAFSRFFMVSLRLAFGAKMQTLVKLLFEFSLQNTKNWIFAEIRWKMAYTYILTISPISRIFRIFHLKKLRNCFFTIFSKIFANYQKIQKIAKLEFSMKKNRQIEKGSILHKQNGNKFWRLFLSFLWVSFWFRKSSQLILGRCRCG